MYKMRNSCTKSQNHVQNVLFMYKMVIHVQNVQSMYKMLKSCTKIHVQNVHFMYKNVRIMYKVLNSCTKSHVQNGIFMYKIYNSCTKCQIHVQITRSRVLGCPNGQGLPIKINHDLWFTCLICKFRLCCSLLSVPLAMSKPEF